MSVLPQSQTPPNLAVSFLMDCSRALMSDPEALAQLDALRACGATEDDIGAKMAALSLQKATSRVALSGAGLILKALASCDARAQRRSLSSQFGEQAASLIFEMDALAQAAPALSRSRVELWRFSDGSMLFHSQSLDAAFSEFCSACLHTPEVIDAWDQKHRTERSGEPLSRAALLYARASLVEAGSTCFPLSHDQARSLFSEQALSSDQWHDGFDIQSLDHNEPISPSMLQSL